MTGLGRIRAITTIGLEFTCRARFSPLTGWGRWVIGCPHHLFAAAHRFDTSPGVPMFGLYFTFWEPDRRGT